MKIQTKIERNFTVVHNEFLQDEKLGIAERGLLITMLSKPDNFDFSIKGLATFLPNGVDSIRTALKNLEQAGYLKRERMIEHGRIVDMVYTVSDCPVFSTEEEAEEVAMEQEPVSNRQCQKQHSEKPESENPNLEKQDLEKPMDLINKDKINTDKTNIDKANTDPVLCETEWVNYGLAVRLTKKQYEALCEKHGTVFAEECVRVLDNYKLATGKKYRSDYYAILNWVEERVEKQSRGKYGSVTNSPQESVYAQFVNQF